MINCWYLYVPVFLMVMDIVSGVSQAFFNKTLSSSKMRVGLGHKLAFVLLLVLGIALDVTQGHFDFGFQIPTLASISVYVACTELVSIAENITLLNPELFGGTLSKWFENRNGDEVE